MLDKTIISSVALLIRTHLKTNLIPAKPVLIKHLKAKGFITTVSIIEAIPSKDWNNVISTIRRIN